MLINIDYQNHYQNKSGKNMMQLEKHVKNRIPVNQTAMFGSCQNYAIDAKFKSDPDFEL